MPSLLATLGLNISNFTRGLGDAKSHASRTGKEIASALGDEISGRLKSFASFTAIEEAMRRSIEYGSKINDLSLRLGVSTDALQEWDHALKMNGGSLDSAAGFFEKLAIARKKALEGSDDQINAFKQLGVTVGDLKSKRIEDIAAQIAGAFETGDPQRLVASLREVGGKGAGEMIPTFVAGFRDLQQEAQQLGLVIREDVIGGLDDMGDQIDTIKTRLISVVAPIAEVFGRGANLLLDALQWIMNVFTGLGYTFIAQIMDDPKKLLNPKAMYEIMKNSMAAVKEIGDETVSETAGRDAAREASKEKAKERRAKIAASGGVGEEEDPKLKKARDDALKREQAKELAENRRDQAKLNKASQFDLNSVQAIGAYASAPEMAMLDIERRSERHLDAIRKDISKLVNKSPGAVSGVEY